MVAEDAHFLGPKNAFAGRERVREGWAGFFKEKEAPFNWKPERVFANAAGTLALSTGPIYGSDGQHVANFSSVWQKDKDGSWKVIFDGPGSALPCPPPAEKKE